MPQRKETICYPPWHFYSLYTRSFVMMFLDCKYASRATFISNVNIVSLIIHASQHQLMNDHVLIINTETCHENSTLNHKLKNTADAA